MRDWILLMHGDAPPGHAPAADAWPVYLARLRASGCFEGGSAIGDGVCVSTAGQVPDVTRHLVGFLRVRAADLDAARALVAGNPVYEAGGTVEIRELPRDG